jgi:hypothetical protein
MAVDFMLINLVFLSQQWFTKFNKISRFYFYCNIDSFQGTQAGGRFLHYKKL